MVWVWADNTGAHVSSQLWKEEEGGRKPGEVSPLSTTLSKAKGHKPAPGMPKFSLHLPPCYWGKRTCQEWSPIPSSHPVPKSWPRLSNSLYVHLSIMTGSQWGWEGAASTRADKHHKQPKSSNSLSNLSLSRTVLRKGPTTTQHFAAPIILE